MYGALEYAGVGHVKCKSFLSQQASGFSGLGDAGGSQSHVAPSGEAIFQVPGGFTMADQYELVHKQKP